ncbi:MAG TPA: hypothetical protein VI685_10130 [Candidatus Angelobacter sp.]
MALTNTRVLGGTQTMAITKSKSSIHPSKVARRNDRRASTRHSDRRKPAERRNQTRSAPDYRIPHPKTIYFHQAEGRVVKQIEFFTDPSSNTLSLRFQDDTSLSFEFATGFAMEAYFSRWKEGNERVLKYWPRTRWEPSF